MIQNIKYISIYINTQQGWGGGSSTLGFFAEDLGGGEGVHGTEFLMFVLNDKSGERKGGDTAGTPQRAHMHTQTQTHRRVSLHLTLIQTQTWDIALQ